jgi:signal transduction histidine kinase
VGALIAKAVALRQSLRDEMVTLGTAHVLLNVEVLRKTPDGGDLGTLVTLRDSESRRQLERQLDVSSRLAAISRLTGGVAHEIKNPLNAIALHLEVLRARLNGPQPEIEVIAKEIKRLDHVVKTFLNFNKPFDVRARPVDLAFLTREAVDLIGVEARQKGIRVEMELADQAWINGDRELLTQAILNVVVNAIEAMKDRGRLELRVDRAAGQCSVRITDEGPGIPPELRDKIFNLYFSTKKNGSGIGLATTFRVVHLHGGSIDLASEVGKGTSFRLGFPEWNAGDPRPSVTADPVRT